MTRSPTPPQQPVRTLERRFADLFDLSLDISRYDSDVAFAAKGGKIYYVFDENIAELFVTPSGNYPYVMYESDVRKPSRSEPTGRETAAIQSALLIGEILFSGKLPGQDASGEFYMTQWHRWEALQRVSEFLSAITNVEGKAIGQSMEASLRAKAELIGADDPVGKTISDDPNLDADLKAFAKLAQVSALEDIVADRFSRVRRAALHLARDLRSEPMQQTNRMLRADKSGRIRNALQAGNLKVRPDPDELADGADIWMDRIRDEVNAAAARSHAKDTKGQTAIGHDARSLALIEWISSKLDQNTQRIVMVTGDPSLFDAYRRAYESDSSENKSGIGPFLLRRPLQYSTLFTGQNQEFSSARRKLFYSLQQQVELPLTPIRIATAADAKISEDVMHRRHSLTLARIEGNNRASYFHDVWTAHGHRYREDQVEAVESQIETTERILNGLSGSLVEARVHINDLTLLRDTIGKEAEERDRLIAAHVEKAVEALMRAALAVWRPEAEDFFKQAAQDGPLLSARRVPLAVHLADPESGRSGSLMRVLDIFLEDPIEEGGRRAPLTFEFNSSFEIFVGAGAVALHANQWRLADHFCEVAINAFTYFAKYENISRHDAAEAHYLSALAKRFRLGEIKARANLDSHGPATKLYDKAVDLLRSSEELSSSAGKGFASYRGYSERAALSLFYASFCTELASRLDGVDKQVEIRAQAQQAFEDAGDYMAEALRIEARSRFEDLRPELHGSHTNRVRLQLLVNIAAWHALVPIIAGKESTIEQPMLASDCIRNLAKIEYSLGRAGTPLFNLELLAFKISQGIDIAGNRQRLGRLSDLDNREAVALDKSLFSMIQEHWRQA